MTTHVARSQALAWEHPAVQCQVRSKAVIGATPVVKVLLPQKRWGGFGGWRFVHQPGSRVLGSSRGRFLDWGRAHQQKHKLVSNTSDGVTVTVASGCHQRRAPGFTRMGRAVVRCRPPAPPPTGHRPRGCDGEGQGACSRGPPPGRARGDQMEKESSRIPHLQPPQCPDPGPRCSEGQRAQALGPEWSGSQTPVCGAHQEVPPHEGREGGIGLGEESHRPTSRLPLRGTFSKDD